MYVSQGRGYRVIVYAPQANFPAWTSVFDQILGRFSAASVGPNNGQPVTQPSTAPLALIAHVFAGQVYVATLVDFPGVPITFGAAETHQYHAVAVSPLGTQLAFTDSGSGKLWIASTQGGASPLTVGDGLAAGYPPAWSPDGREVAYLRADGALNAARSDGAGTRKIGQIAVKATQSVTGSPAEALYTAETGQSGNRVLLAWGKDGHLYFSLGADGIGLGRIDPGGAVTTINDNIRRISLSPDGREALGVVTVNGQDTAVRLTLSDAAQTPVSLTGVPDQLAWSADGKQIYYTLLTPKAALKVDDATQQERITAVFGSFPISGTVHDMQLRALDLASGATVDLFKAEGRGIGRLLPSPDSSGLLFSVVQSDALLVEAFKNNVNGIELRRQFPAVQLYWLGKGQKQPLLLAITTAATWGQLGSAPAPTPTGGFKTPVRRLTLTPTPSATPLPPTATPERRLPPPTNTPRG
jgi:DNA-binding beta-propeller fold protein YncE